MVVVVVVVMDGCLRFKIQTFFCILFYFLCFPFLEYNKGKNK